MQVELGTKVRDTVTGYEGVATGATTWLNGCVRYAIQGDGRKDGIPVELYWADEQQIEAVEDKPLESAVEAGKTGGPRSDPSRCSDPTR
jgi:hypothetical protein